MDFKCLDDKKKLRLTVSEEIISLSKTRKDIRSLLQAMFQLDRMPSGMNACLLYLQLFLGEPIHTKELQIVSGISAYARRLRQLRHEKGYDIVVDRAQNGWTYSLRSEHPNEVLADMWAKRNAIRRMKGSGEDRILALFKMFVGEPLDIDDLAYVSKIRTARERARDLRLHKGWRIFGQRTGRPELRITEYVLESLEQLPPHDREIPDELYEYVLERDGTACKKCGWTYAQRTQTSRRQFLELHHKKLHFRGGQHEDRNLVTLCNMHHDVVHRRKIEEAEFDHWLAEA